MVHAIDVLGVGVFINVGNVNYSYCVAFYAHVPFHLFVCDVVMSLQGIMHSLILECITFCGCTLQKYPHLTANLKVFYGWFCKP